MWSVDEWVVLLSCTTEAYHVMAKEILQRYYVPPVVRRLIGPRQDKQSNWSRNSRERGTEIDGKQNILEEMHGRGRPYRS